MQNNNLNIYYYNARWCDPNLGRFITEDHARDGNNWYIYASNNPIIRIDPTGLRDIVTANGELTYVQETEQFFVESGGTVAENSEITIQRHKDDTGNFYQSTATLSIVGEEIIKDLPVQSWADHPDLNLDDAHLGMTLPAGEYEARLVGESGSHLKPLWLINPDLGATENDYYFTHTDTFTAGVNAGAGPWWAQSPTGEWIPNGPYGLGCQIFPGNSWLEEFVPRMESHGMKFGSGYMEWSEKMTLTIKDPIGIHTASDGTEINKRGL